GGHIQAPRQAAAGLAAEGKAKHAVGLGQPSRGAGVGVEQPREAFAEDHLWAVWSGAAEATNPQAESDESALAGDVRDRAAVVAMRAIRGRPTARAIGRHSR